MRRLVVVAVVAMLGCEGPQPCTLAELIPLYQDRDGDGYGVPDPSGLEICPKEPVPPGYSTLSGDCADDDARAFPGQADFQATPLAHPNVYRSIWDFNCDGFATRRWEATGICAQGPGFCSIYAAPNVVGGYWSIRALADSAPGCGEDGLWIDWCRTLGQTCIVDGQARVQECL